MAGSIKTYNANCPSNAFASFRSSVSKPSVNPPGGKACPPRNLQGFPAMESKAATNRENK